jgi:hypothetical protein
MKNMRLNHTDFILSPITDILKDSISASAGIGSGIETYPLSDYVMQSVFLKMTGFQEQKMKCIAWDLATIDYEYRYKRYTQKTLGECSRYAEKNEVYKDLISCIRKFDNNFNFQINKTAKLNVICKYIRRLFDNTNLSAWIHKDYNSFEAILLNQIGNSLSDNNNLFDNQNDDKMDSNNHIRKIYNHLYRHRNRCAHNTPSYQQNLPTLKTLVNVNYQYENYFVRFATLVLIDKVFIELYKKYLETLEVN